MTQPSSTVLAPPSDHASADVIRLVRAMAENLGQVEAAHTLGVSRAAMLAVIAGLRVRPSTLALCEQRARAYAKQLGLK